MDRLDKYYTQAPCPRCPDLSYLGGHPGLYYFNPAWLAMHMSVTGTGVIACPCKFATVVAIDIDRLAALLAASGIAELLFPAGVPAATPVDPSSDLPTDPPAATPATTPATTPANTDAINAIATMLRHKVQPAAAAEPGDFAATCNFTVRNVAQRTLGACRLEAVGDLATAYDAFTGQWWILVEAMAGFVRLAPLRAATVALQLKSWLNSSTRLVLEGDSDDVTYNDLLLRPVVCSTIRLLDVAVLAVTGPGDRLGVSPLDTVLSCLPLPLNVIPEPDSSESDSFGEAADALPADAPEAEALPVQARRDSVGSTLSELAAVAVAHATRFPRAWPDEVDGQHEDGADAVSPFPWQDDASTISTIVAEADLSDDEMTGIFAEPNVPSPAEPED